MVFINEWLPNPTGDDAKAEFIELFNNGSGSVNLRGWTLRTSGKKIFSLDGYTIAANGYLLLDRDKTKITLKNSDESLFLYDAQGQLADYSTFLGSAQEGKSLSRINYGTDPSEHFAWSDPTPGTLNKITANTEISASQYPLGVPLNHFYANGPEVFGMMVGIGVILALLVIYVLKSNENLSKLIFSGDEEFRF